VIIALIVILVCAGLYAMVSEFRVNEQRKFIKAQSEYIRSLEHKINRRGTNEISPETMSVLWRRRK